MSNSEFEIPDFFDPNEEAGTEDLIFRKRPVGQWIEVQINRGQLVVPKITKPVPMGDTEHTVMWVERRKVENGSCKSCHQIVCDCAMEVPIEDLDNGRFGCRA